MIKNSTPVTEKELDAVSKVLKLFDVPIDNLRVCKNTVGFVNKTFIIELGDKKLVLRESSPATTFDHLELEIEVLRYLAEKNYSLSPRLLPNKSNQYLVNYENHFYTLQTFTPGEIKASWNDLSNFTGEMLEGFFRAWAGFARIIEDFKPSREYKNFPLIYYMNEGESIFDSLFNKISESPGKELLLEYRPALMEFLEHTKNELGKYKYDDFPKQLVHFDIHPGNVHFDRNKVVGLFDFDWVRFDCRISDIAATIGQSCYVYGGDKSGLYDKNKVMKGLKAYREAYGPSEFTETEENQLIRMALQGYMFFQVFWSMDWYRDNIMTAESLFPLQHMINTCLINDYGKLFS